MKILISGASRGIGLAEAKKLDNGNNELFLVATSKNSFKDKSLKNAFYFGYDLRNEQNILKLYEEIKTKTNFLDVIISNVGIIYIKKFEKLNFEEINSMLSLNLKSHILTIKQFLPLLRQSKAPKIIFMSSMAAKSSVVGESVYAATKSGLTSFANVLRNEFKDEIKISTIHSWGVNTSNFSSENLLKPENIAEVVEFILSRENNFLIESIELSHINQWRGGDAPWSPK